MRRVLLVALMVALMVACSVERDADLEGYRVYVLAHELGHAAGLEHAETGVMTPYRQTGHALPTEADWHPVWAVDCVNWQVPAGLEPEFEAAGEAWCVASSGEFCPWLYDVAVAPCQVRWAELDGSVLGRWSRHLIQIDSALR